MSHTIDNLTIGQRIAVRYAKTPDTPQTYYGQVEKITDKVLTLKKRDGSFRSFSFPKIVTVVTV